MDGCVPNLASHLPPAAMNTQLKKSEVARAKAERLKSKESADLHNRLGGDDVHLHAATIDRVAKKIVEHLRYNIMSRHKTFPMHLTIRLDRRAIHHVLSEKLWKEEVSSAVNSILRDEDGLDAYVYDSFEGSQVVNTLGFDGLLRGCLCDDLLLRADANELRGGEGMMPLNIVLEIMTWGLIPCIGCIRLLHRKIHGLRVVFLANNDTRNDDERNNDERNIEERNNEERADFGV